MKLALLILLIVPTTTTAPSRKTEQFVYTREWIGSHDWIDSVTIAPDTYIDVRYDYNPDGIGVTMLGCFVRGVPCDSSAMFKRLVSETK